MNLAIILPPAAEISLTRWPPQQNLRVAEWAMQMQAPDSQPEKDSVQILPAKGADEPLDKRMRARHVRHGADGLDFQDPQIGLPPLELKQGIVVQTQSHRKPMAGNGLVEHAAEGDSVDGARLHPKANDFPRKLIHHDQDPMRLEEDRFNPKQVQAPKAVFGLPKQREPGRTIRGILGSLMCRQDPPDHVLVDLNTESFSQLLRHPWTAKTRVALLEFKDGSDQFRCWSLGTGLAPPTCRVQAPIFVCFEGRMKCE